jgi:adenosine deaminase
VVALARERGTPFEVCVTSNFHSGVVDEIANHPIRKMIESGLNVTINTDDPSISRINLSYEYQTVHKQLGLSMDVIGTRVKAAAQAAFLPPELRNKLANAIEKEFMRKLILPD